METKHNTHPIIADASGLISPVVETDRNHAAAVAGAERLVDQHVLVLIPSELLAETVNMLGKRFGHTVAFRAMRTVLESPIFLVTDAGEGARLNALALYATMPAHVSFTDCLVMTVADKHHTKAIFGFDKQFEKSGYERLQPTEDIEPAA